MTYLPFVFHTDILYKWLGDGYRVASVQTVVRSQVIDRHGQTWLGRVH